MSAAAVLSEKSSKKSDKATVTSGGVAMVDAVSAARLLKANGVLASAKQHMNFYKVVIKRASPKSTTLFDREIVRRGDKKV